MELKQEYIERINQLMQETTDIGLLDLIKKLLEEYSNPQKRTAKGYSQ